MSQEVEFAQFHREEEGLPRLVSCANISKADRPDLTFAWMIRLPYSGQDNGLPIVPELHRCYKIEDQLEKVLSPVGAVLMGHITFKGAITVVFRGQRRPQAEVEVKTGLLRKEKFAVEYREDPDWSWHEREMAPTPRERHMSRNEQLMEALEKGGDRHEIVRPVDFAAFFKNPSGRSAFLQAVEPAGYRLNSEGTWEDDQGGFWCGFSKSTSIEPEVIADCCVYVDEQARIQNGEFDGWATPVQKG